MATARLLGGASLHTDDGVVRGPGAQRHRLALVALLTLSRSRPLSRDKLVAMLWPNRDTEHGRGLLKQSVHMLRRELGRQAILSAGDALSLNVEAVTSDVASFESALAAGELDRAASLYAGPLLDGFHLPDAPDFERWVDGERERLRRAYMQALEQLAEIAAARGDANDAIERWRQVSAEDPYNARVTLRLMEALDAAGDRTGAIQQARAHTLRLRQDLDAEPDAEVSAFAKRLRADPSGGAHSRELARASSRGTPATSARVGSATAAAEPTAPRYALVGRDAEWARLRCAWTDNPSRGSHFALILGEAGIGKTRLAEELLEWARRQAITTARTRCYAAEGRLPYAPVADWLRCPAFRTGLEMLEPTWLAEVARLLPELRQAHPDLQTPDVTGAWQRQRLFSALARAVLARPQPMILVVDDLQWCDQETLEWVHYLLRFDAAARLLVVGTARDEELSPGHPLSTLRRELGREEKVTAIALRALTADATAALGARVAGVALTPEVAAELYRETEGHPLFVVESVRGRVLDPTMTVPTDRTARGATLPRSGDSAFLAPAVQAVIEARLTRLSPSARTVAGVAATIGRDFTLDVLLQAGESNDDVIASLDELCDRRILREHGSGRFDFSHDKLREVAYRAVGPARRRMLHRRAAEALSLVHASDLDPVSAQIAAHYERGGVAERAVAFFQRAAEVAKRIYANEEAIALLERALRILATLPETVERHRREMALQTALCAPIRASRGWAVRELAETTARARELADQVGTDAERLKAMWEQTAYQVTRCDLRPALDSARDALRLAISHGDAALLAPAHVWMGNQLCQRGEFALSHRYLDRATSLYDRSYHARHLDLFGADYGVLARVFDAHALWHLGCLDQASRTSREAIALAESLAHPFSRAIALAYDATLLQFTGDPKMTHDRAMAVLALSTEFGFTYYHAWGTIHCGWALAMQGKTRRGIAMLRSGMDAMRADGAELRRSYYLSLLAEACGSAGQTCEGLELVEEALTTSAATGECWKDAELHRLRGDLLLMRAGRESDAESSFRQALAVAERQEARALQLRATLALGRLLRRSGRRDEVRHTIAPLCEWFTEGLDSRDLVEARALLAE